MLGGGGGGGVVGVVWWCGGWILFLLYLVMVGVGSGLWQLKPYQDLWLIWIEGGVEESKVEMTENKLILT